MIYNKAICTTKNPKIKSLLILIIINLITIILFKATRIYSMLIKTLNNMMKVEIN